MKMLAAIIAISGLTSLATAQPAVQPESVRPGVPGPVADELGVAMRPSLIREGAFVSQSRGQLIRGKTGRWFFVFDPDASGRTLPPMVVLPNQHLSAMERVAERAGSGGKSSMASGEMDRARLAVTGMVTAYRGLNYLLPTAPPLLVRPESPVEAVPANATPTKVEPAAASKAEAMDDGTEANKTATTPAAEPASAAAEPSIDEIVTRLDKAVSSVSATAPLRVSPPSAGDTAPSLPLEVGGDTVAANDRLLPPGLLVSRRGRVVRGPDGALLFRIDSGASGAPGAGAGASGAAMGGGMLTLLPCQNLTSIELVSERAGEGATYTMSGDVFAYRGRNYLLVRSYQVNRTSEQVMPVQ